MAVALAEYAWVQKEIEPQRRAVDLTDKSRTVVAENINYVADYILAGIEDIGT